MPEGQQPKATGQGGPKPKPAGPALLKKGMSRQLSNVKATASDKMKKSFSFDVEDASAWQIMTDSNVRCKAFRFATGVTSRNLPCWLDFLANFTIFLMVLMIFYPAWYFFRRLTSGYFMMGAGCFVFSVPFFCGICCCFRCALIEKNLEALKQTTRCMCCPGVCCCLYGLCFFLATIVVVSSMPPAPCCEICEQFCAAYNAVQVQDRASWLQNRKYHKPERPRSELIMSYIVTQYPIKLYPWCPDEEGLDYSTWCHHGGDEVYPNGCWFEHLIEEERTIYPKMCMDQKGWHAVFPTAWWHTNTAISMAGLSILTYFFAWLTLYFGGSIMEIKVPTKGGKRQSRERQESDVEAPTKGGQTCIVQGVRDMAI